MKMPLDKKDWIFHQWWRVNYARNLLSIIFWTSTFVGVWIPLVQIVMPGWNKWVIGIILGVGSVFFTLFIGYVWDKLRFWHIESKFNVTKNWAYHEPVGKEREHLFPLMLETAKEVAKQSKEKNVKLEKQIKKTEQWLADMEKVCP